MHIIVSLTVKTAVQTLAFLIIWITVLRSKFTVKISFMATFSSEKQTNKPKKTLLRSLLKRFGPRTKEIASVRLKLKKKQGYMYAQIADMLQKTYISLIVCFV